VTTLRPPARNGPEPEARRRDRRGLARRPHWGMEIRALMHDSGEEV
jgi:hypothetical protein